MGSERRESAHVTDLGTAYCLNRDIRTRHNDNDDALCFFFFHNNISVYDELPLWGALMMQGEVYRISMQSMWPVVVHLMGIVRPNSKPPET